MTSGLTGHEGLDSAPLIAAVCLPRTRFEAPTSGISSGINKLPVAHRVPVDEYGFEGDHQGDTEHHGGLFKAVYAFSRETREQIAATEGRDFPDGFFGENLVTLGIDTDEVLVGQRWRIGAAVLEASCRRDPCRTFADWMGDPRFPRRFTENGRCGAYFRVVTPGTIGAGDVIEELPRPEHGVSVGDTFRGVDARQARALLDWAQDTQTVLYTSQVRSCLTALRREKPEATFPAALTSTGR